MALTESARSDGVQPASAGCPAEAPPAPQPAGEIRFLGDLERLEMKPGDRFVLTIDRVISMEMHARIQEAWRAFVGGDADDLKLLILDGGMKLGVVATSED